MKIIKLLNVQRKTIGQIDCILPDQVNINVSDPSLSVELDHLIKDACENGLPLRSGRFSESKDRKVFAETVERIKTDDERFLSALADVIGQRRFGDQRIFCLVKEMESPNAHI